MLFFLVFHDEPWEANTVRWFDGRFSSSPENPGGIGFQAMLGEVLEGFERKIVYDAVFRRVFPLPAVRRRDPVSFVTRGKIEYWEECHPIWPWFAKSLAISFSKTLSPCE
jgi:hypothetical protein